MSLARIGALGPQLRGWFTGRRLVIGIPYFWLLVFFLLPFLILAKISVSEMETVHFKDLITYSDGLLRLTLKLGNYVFITEDELYWRTYLASLKYAAATTVLCLAIGYPFAYFMARARSSVQPALLMLVMLPFWTSFLLRVYPGWDCSGLIPAAGKLMHTPFSLVLGMVYTYLPFMILPLYGNLAKTGSAPAGGCCGSGRHALGGVLEGHGAPVQGRHHRRLDAGVHPLRGRIRHSGTARWPGDHDDRPHHVG
jgi:ABC-type spermidine/putrescine transport system permease subunit I